MLNTITLNKQEFTFNQTYLPCLINGIDGSGASDFSIRLVAELIRKQNKLIIFTAYPMARAKLQSLVDNSYLQEINSITDLDNVGIGKSLLVESGNLELLHEVLKSIHNLGNYIIFIKNIEKYKDLSPVIWENTNNLLLSGSVDECLYKDKIMDIDWSSKIIFTPSENIPVESFPKLEKYEAYLDNTQVTGILRLV